MLVAVSADVKSLSGPTSALGLLLPCSAWVFEILSPRLFTWGHHLSSRWNFRRLTFTLSFMDHPDKSFHRPTAPVSTGRAVALLDARYLRWIARLDEPDAAVTGSATLSRERLNELLQHALHRAVGRVSLLRLYWYVDTDDRLVCNDQTLRLLPSADSDGSALVRQLTADVQALVAGGRVDAILIGSDDDRLLGVMEWAKLAGLTVCVLADERAQAMPRLMQQDPNWARLLREADRRVIVRSGELAHALGGQGGAPSDDSPAEGFEEGRPHRRRPRWPQGRAARTARPASRGRSRPAAARQERHGPGAQLP